jgi:hypothetical protein
MHPTPSAGRTVVFLAGMAFLSCCAPGLAAADIYRWVDESGGLHFTDDLSSIPERHRGKVQDVQKTPPRGGTVSTIGGGAGSSPAPTVPASPLEAIGASPESPTRESLEGQAEQLRAKIVAKEQFIDKVDTKRSTLLNPLGNRFVSPEDLELYKKYSDELPGDRERLREIESGLPQSVN